MKRTFLYAALISGLALTLPAVASADVRVGTLTCNEHGGWGYILGGSHSMACTFSGEGRVEHYHGNIGKYGVNIGYQSSGTLVWAVFAPSADYVRSHALAGHYAGVTGGAAIGVGAAGNALIGGFDRSFMLQPVSIEGMTGLNVAAGIGTMSLG
jgi:hypothetical protein